MPSSGSIKSLLVLRLLKHKKVASSVLCYFNNSIAAMFFLIASLPLLVIAISLLRLSVRGSVFFFQSRRGFNGKPFFIIKLRTLGPYGRRNISPVARVIRSLSIDEIPQFVNVIKGEMALIGPRPHPIELDEEFEKKLPMLPERYLVLPGITGLAQVSKARGSVNSYFEMRRRLWYDLLYVRSQSFRLDLYILIKTIFGGFYWPEK